MRRATIAGGAFALALALLAVAVGYRALVRSFERTGASAPEVPSSSSSAAAHAPAASDEGFLYGRVVPRIGTPYEGRLRWGGDEEAFWGDYFNGAKKENPWVVHVPPERLPKQRRPIELFGFEIASRERPLDLDRLFMARFGDIARIEAIGTDVRVTLKSGTFLDLDRLEASDFDDGLRVWDGARGTVDLDSLEIQAVELLPTARSAAAPYRVHGTVRSREGGEFTGFVQWNREKGVGTDEIRGRAADGELRLRFDTLRSIERHSPESSLVTRLDGREVVLSGSREVGEGNRGLYVDDPRYGRVLVSWDAFARVDFDEGGAEGSGPGYGDFPPGRPLAGSVTTRDGRRLAGRLVYDLDESETTETLDAPSAGVTYTIPFGRIASIAPGGREGRGAALARVTFRGGEELELERAGDLGEGNAGLLIFVAGSPRPDYVPWPEVERIDLDSP